MITAHWTSLLIVENCGFPLWPAPIMISQNFLMLALFGDFYRKSYLQTKSPNAVTAAKKKEINDANNNDNNNAMKTTPSAMAASTSPKTGVPDVANGLTKRH